MASRVRAGNLSAFWNNATTGAGTASTAVEISRSTEHIVIYVTVSGANTITVEVTPTTGTNAEGVWAESGTVWYQLVNPGTTATPVQHVFAGAGSAAIQIPDFVAKAVRLKSSASVTATAGYETIGD